ncbi:hypothetical protein [Polaromonas naphthalenivorans]|uniref:Uncharacterized protein n=1 Tax=Polaromonas naphthalenivorans (strain CJ2) TaxID=365044 RepID=A1VVB6_POLNA|nr:hypothetical protein [Polaromonas naphthalenivorans]ABM39594.1 hypothetical protein Pnap_4312 [Polaromonas naphthalenivorans CJ2]
MTLLSFPSENKSRNLPHKLSQTLAHEKFGDAVDCLRECVEVLETISNPENQEFLARFIRKIKQSQQELQIVKSQAHVTECGGFGNSNSIFNLSIHHA